MRVCMEDWRGGIGIRAGGGGEGRDVGALQGERRKGEGKRKREMKTGDK